MSYSEDLRGKVIRYLEEGNTQREASKAFHINTETVNRWHQRYEKTGEVKDAPPRRKFRKLDPEKLKTYVKAHPDGYLKEIGEVFGCTDMAVFYAFKRMGITRKKRGRDTKSKN